jgi:hypothetical protein
MLRKSRLFPVFCAFALLTVPASSQTRVDANGTIVQSVAPAGSNGKDYSGNQPTLPSVGGAFGSTGSYANYVLIATVPASAARFNIDVENNAGAQIAIGRDDGTAAIGSTPVNASVFALGGGSAAGAQGGSWSSQTFKGRVQVYAPVGAAQVAVMVE